MGNFHSSKKFNPQRDIADLSGRVAIVTGGNAGIGYYTVKFLAQRGAKVYLAARNESKATGAIVKLEHEGLGSGGTVVFLKLDLSDPRMAKSSAQEFLSKEPRLDILVNNAGMLTDHQLKIRKTNDGILEMMATNYIGPYVFTRTLLDLLVKTAEEPESDVRIVNVNIPVPSYTGLKATWQVSSHLHRLAKPGTDFGSPEIFRDECKEYTVPSFARYGVSKYAMNLWTSGLQRRLDESLTGKRPILVMAVHPGSVNTFAHLLPLPRLFDLLFRTFMVGADEGAATSLFAGASPLVRADPAKYRGEYMLPVGTLTLSAAMRDPEMAGNLWTNTESFLQGLGL
ncbi:NAD(P)-binding protein [Mycena maculata]|uniref:NAD(P)-binding protein n=1 Tax=Mycena maculata TaxID=230809 RepID=A0AAD7NGN1_9AGAR|nr:NAD(P)-binding protein [Mycena maculata]